MDPQLYDAVRCGDENFIRDFQSSDETTLPKVTPETGTVLHVAARFRKTEIATLILEKHTSLIRQKNSKGDTPLHIAARIGDSEMVRLLVNHEVAESHQEVDEADEKLVQIINIKGETALHDAVRGGHLEVVKLLIEKDPLLATLTTGGGESPLFLAVERMHIEIAAHILSILSYDAPSCSFQGRNNMNALHAAIIRGCNLDFIKKLLGKSPSAILKVDNNGCTALHHAACLGEDSILEALLSTDNSNSIAYARDKEGMTALHNAAKEGRDVIMRKLAQRFPDIWDLVDNKGQTALHVATKLREAKKIVKLILKEVPDDIIKRQDNEGNSSLHLAALGGNFEIIELLINDGRVDQTAINNEGVAFTDILLSINKDPEVPLKVIANGDSRRLASLDRVINKLSEKNIPAVDDNEDDKEAINDNEEDKEAKDAKALANANKVVAALIVGVTFAAVCNLPGGYNNDGKPNSADEPSFICFVFANSLSFSFSFYSLLLHFFTYKKRSLKVAKQIRMLNVWSVFFLPAAFISGLAATLADPWGWSMSTGIIPVSFIYLAPLVVLYTGIGGRRFITRQIRHRRRVTKLIESPRAGTRLKANLCGPWELLKRSG